MNNFISSLTGTFFLDSHYATIQYRRSFSSSICLPETVKKSVQSLLNSSAHQAALRSFPSRLLPTELSSTKIPTFIEDTESLCFQHQSRCRCGAPIFQPKLLEVAGQNLESIKDGLVLTTTQTYLNIAGIDHRLISSNNHASPTGNLPFLLPSAQTSNSAQESIRPVPSAKFVKYATDHGGRIEEVSSICYEAYQSLLDHRIRNAWVCNAGEMLESFS